MQVGIIDTGVSVHHHDLSANTQKKCEDFVNGDGSCDEGSIKGPSKVRQSFSSFSPHVVGTWQQVVSCVQLVVSLTQARASLSQRRRWSRCKPERARSECCAG